MRIHLRVDQAVHKAVSDDMTHNQGVQEEVRSKLFEAVEQRPQLLMMPVKNLLPK